MADSRCWTKEFVIGFIKKYQQNPCLWRVKSKEYTNKKMKNEAYDRLVEYCKPVFPEANRDFVSKKVQSLRGSFRKEMKKVNDSISNGDEVYIPTLWYYDHLAFIKDQEPSANGTYMDSEDTHNSIGEPDDSDYEEISIKEDRFFDDHVEPNMNSSDEGQYTETLLNQEKASLHQQLEQSNSQPTSSKLKRKSSMIEATYDFMKLCTRAIEASVPTEAVQEYDAVGINVSKKLQKMDPVQAIHAEKLIHMVLTRGLLRGLHPNTSLSDSN